VQKRYTPRLATFDYVGTYRYSLTFCTFHRRPHFISADIIEPIALKFSQCAERHRFAISAYCFMPDHVHLLIEGLTGSSSALPFISAAKQATGYWFKKLRNEPLWQRSGWDRIVRSDQQTIEVVRYLLMNPVRAGLVDSPLEYPFSGSEVFSREQLLTAFDRGPAG